jgi:hypothetical protein
MILLDFVIAFFVALLLSLVVFVGLRRTGPWASFLFLFLALFLATWAGGIWITPIGQPLGGSYWLPFLMAGVVFALLLASITPADRTEESTIKLVTEEEKQARERTVRRAAGVLFWLFAGVLVLIIVLRYLRGAS